MLIWFLWPKFALFTEYVIWDFRTVVMGSTNSIKNIIDLQHKYKWQHKTSGVSPEASTLWVPCMIPVVNAAENTVMTLESLWVSNGNNELKMLFTWNPTSHQNRHHIEVLCCHLYLCWRSIMFLMLLVEPHWYLIPVPSAWRCIYVILRN
jgi:hypothetical protein